MASSRTLTTVDMAHFVSKWDRSLPSALNQNVMAGVESIVELTFSTLKNAFWGGRGSVGGESQIYNSQNS